MDGKKAERKKPIAIRRDSVAVRIYTSSRRVGTAVYPRFELVHYVGDKRIKRSFAELCEAKREGELVATKLANGERQVLTLTSTDRSSCQLPPTSTARYSRHRGRIL